MKLNIKIQPIIDTSTDRRSVPEQYLFSIWDELDNRYVVIGILNRDQLFAFSPAVMGETSATDLLRMQKTVELEFQLTGIKAHQPYVPDSSIKVS